MFIKTNSHSQKAWHSQYNIRPFNYEQEYIKDLKKEMLCNMEHINYYKVCFAEPKFNNEKLKSRAIFFEFGG